MGVEPARSHQPHHWPLTDVPTTASFEWKRVGDQSDTGNRPSMLRLIVHLS